jgi:DNA-binding CsgD family transcriptional regulator/tetratricopeptide (TPR) repeat protein
MVVGREVELDHLRRAFHAAREGGSRCVFLVGEGGVGKTRLLAEVAAESRQLGLGVMAGRSPVTSPVAFSVVSEALRSWLRAHPTARAMAPFDAGLRLLLPEWPVDTAADVLSDAQLRLLALEGVVRLVQEIAATSRGAVILLDDLHAADADSLEAIRYLATSARDGVLIVGALRARESKLPEQVVRTLARDGVADVLDLEPLGRREVGELLGALLDAEPPQELVDDVLARTDGIPLLVEEVLDAHVRSGTVDVGELGARWRGGITTVPRTVRDMVEERLARLTSPQREVVTAGAVLGGFDASVLAVVAQQSTASVGDVVAAATNAGLLETVGGAVDFRHALLREAVLEATQPHVLHTLHQRAAAALADIPVGNATTLERRAQHLEQIDEHDEAAELLAAAAAAQLAEHALLSAEVLARRALDLARVPAARAAASDTLARVLAAQGRWTDALALDTAADRDYGEQQDRRYRMATCAMDAAQPELAGALVARAIEAGDESPRVRVILGRLAIADGAANEALEAAERALVDATMLNDVETRCAALDVQARALDYAGRRTEARLAWTRQADEAAAAGLTEARLRAVVQLGKLEVFEGAQPDRLYEAVDLARATGALVEQAWAEENLAIALIIQGDPDAGAKILDNAIGRCRELRLDQLPYLLAARGGAASLREEDSAVAFLDEAERLAPTADLAIHTYGIRADMACRAGQYDEALDWCQRGVELMRAQPGGMPSDSPCWLVWFLAAVGRTDDAAVALRDARSLPDDLARWHGRPVMLAGADALLLGDESGIDAAFETATGRMPLDLALMRVIAAGILDGPARGRWLREALDTYQAMGLETAAARVRRLLREAGAPVPRRRRVAGNVPEELAPHGVTAREAEVLRLLGDGLANAVIAERLYLSVRTVETHVSSLLSKLHVEARGQLIALSATLVHEK